MYTNKNKHSLRVSDLAIKSHGAYDIQQKIKGSMVNKSFQFDDQWQLQRAFTIDNKTFNLEFNDKRTELQKQSLSFAQSEIRYGFLATIKESMIHKVADEGLEVRLCPYNYFGHSISGIHISQNADVCMNEASNKVALDDEIILIVFKYMLGKHKIVPMYNPDILLAPTPNFDSHLCEDRPDPTEKVANQYIKSLVYLYEFENGNFDPTIRPRHCCPVSALVFKRGRSYPVVDLTDQEPVKPTLPIYDDNPISFLKPIQHSHWGREFLLNPSTSKIGSSIVIQKNERDDSRKVVVSKYNGTNLQPSPRLLEDRIERWEPIRHEFGYPGDLEDEREIRSRSRTRRSINEMGTDELLRLERDRSFDRLRTWRDNVISNQSQHFVDKSPDFDNGVGNFDIRRISHMRNWFQ